MDETEIKEIDLSMLVAKIEHLGALRQHLKAVDFELIFQSKCLKNRLDAINGIPGDKRISKEQQLAKDCELHGSWLNAFIKWEKDDKMSTNGEKEFKRLERIVDLLNAAARAIRENMEE